MGVALTSLTQALAERDNDYSSIVAGYERRSGLSWHEALRPEDVDAGPSLSVLIPARNVAYALPAVLDSLLQARRQVPVREIIVVDDGSTDETAEIAAGHPAADLVIAMPERRGAAVARNVATLLARGETVLYLDADMLVSAGVLGEHTARADSAGVLLGFRHNIAYDDERVREPFRGEHRPSLEADYRVNWHARAGRLLYTGTYLPEPVRARPLDETDDLRALGHAAVFYDWDLPRMVVTALMSAPREAVVRVGGFHPDFGGGWGVEDTHLGAKLIAAGLKVVPLRHAVGFHVDPPDADAEWQRKLSLWERNIKLYRRLLGEPLTAGGDETLRARTEPLIDRCMEHS